MKPTRLILIPALASWPAPYLVVAADGAVMERGVLALDPVERPAPMRTVAVTPGADVAARWLTLPPGPAAQVRAAAVWALRDDLAAAPDRLAAALGPAVAGEPRLVAVVGRALLEAWVDYLDALGVRADALVPDMLTVPEPEDPEALAAVAFGDSLVLRGRRFAAAVQPELAELVAAGRRIEAVEAAQAVEAALIAAARAPLVNLLEPATQAGRGGATGWRRAAALAAVAALSPLVLVLASAARDDLTARRLERQTRADIARLDPALAQQADPAAALLRRAAVAPPPGGTGAAAAALFAAVEGVEGAELDLLTAGPEDGLKATVAHPDYGDMAILSRRLGEAGLSLTETATLDDAGRVVSDITLGAAR